MANVGKTDFWQYGMPILCAACHLSEALPNTGLAGIPPLTQSMHAFHGHVEDPTNHLTLEADANRSSCYRCHPGLETRCLRGAMGAAVAADGSLAIQCQSCHGSMSAVGATTRTGWLNEPNCQSCHTGDAASNNGLIRCTSALEANGQPRVAGNQLFATSPNAPAAGLSLYRFSRGHGGLSCEACHGSTHAEFPSIHPNDNVQSIQHQGHIGMFVECVSCHVTSPVTVNGGPHGLHPVGQVWVSQHANDAEQNGPGNDSADKNRAPVVANASVATATNTLVAIPLQAIDADGNALTLRVVSQAAHGTVGLVDTTATYYPEKNHSGGDSFTFALVDADDAIPDIDDSNNIAVFGPVP